ncbi:MAG: tetratricopeptide repeat protein [Bacteroidia bacterium]|nr:tetratricopeptide repeat protein [Bacteroidia bacterium]
MKRLLSLSIVLVLLTCRLNAQKTAALDDKIKLYNTAIELYDKQLYNAAISNFMEYLPFATDQMNVSDVEYYIASCKLKLLHNNALSNMLDFMERYPNSRKLNHANLEVGDYYFNIAKHKTALGYYKKVAETNLTKEERQKLAFRKGYCYFKSNKLDDAKRTLYPLTNTDNPYRQEATYYYGYVCYLNKDYREALSAFKKVDDDNIGAVKLYIAEIYYLTGEHQKSIDYAQGKDFGELNNKRDLLLGKCYYRLGDYQKAEDFFEKSKFRIEDLSNSEAYEIGYTYYSNSNCNKSSLLFEKIANSGDAMAQSASYHLGDCYLKVGKKQNAFNAFYEAQRTEFNKDIQEEAMFAYARLAHELEYTSKAIAAYQKFIEYFPKSQYKNEASKNLATILYSTNDYRAAIAILEGMTISDDATKELFQKILFLRAQELYLQKDYSNSEAMFKKSLTHKVDNSIAGQCYYWLGEIDYNRGNNDAARINYQRFMDNAESKKTKYYPEALYGVAYTYYNQQKYAEAANYFNRYKTSIGYTLPENMFHDATLRLGDCYFALSNYNAALDAYTYIISNRKSGADYAMFQQGMIYGLQGKQTNKINILKKISRDFPNSPYIPDAIFQTAEVYLSQENYLESERQLKYLIEDYPNSKWVKESHVKLASLYYRQGLYDKSISEYKFIVKTYPGTPEAQKAMKNAEAAYKKQGQVKEYLDWAKTVPNTNITSSKEDSLYYDAAYRKYTLGDCPGAIKDFKEYMNNFANGFFLLESNYYSAQCYLKEKNETAALTHLKYVADNQNSEFKEDAILKICNIYIARQDCEAGLPYYQLLEKYANNTLSIRKALYYQVQCLNKIGNTTEAAEKSKQLLRYDQLSNAEKGLSNNTIGKNLVDSGYYNSAKIYFAKTLKNQQDEYAAEAKYYEAYIRYSQDSLDKCRKSIMEFNHQFSNYDYWLGRTFILFSDYYVKKGDLFQAKATLNSVLENFDNPEIIEMAKRKLEALEPKPEESSSGDE